MEEINNKWRRMRIAGAVSLGLLIFAGILPNTGGMIEHQPPGFWRCGPFVFDPLGFLGAIIVVVGLILLTIIGIKRRDHCETIGWLLMMALLIGSILFS